MNVAKTDFGTTKDGQPVDLYMLSNGNGLSMKVMTYGGIVTEMNVPDRKGNVAAVRRSPVTQKWLEQTLPPLLDERA